MVNHFSIMLQRRLREDNGEDQEDEGEKSGKKKKEGGRKGGDLRIHDLEDELEMSSDESDCSVGEGKFAPSAPSPSPPKPANELRRYHEGFRLSHRWRKQDKTQESPSQREREEEEEEGR